MAMLTGRERTQREWSELFAAARFELVRCVNTPAATSLLEVRLAL